VPDWSVHNVADIDWWVNERFGARTMLVPFQVGAGDSAGVEAEMERPS
jgi:hypothetical protein